MMANDWRAAAGLSGAVALAVFSSLVLAPEALWGIAIVPAMIAAAFLFWGAARGSRIAILVVVFAAVFLVDANFRNRDYADKAVDFQVLIKIGIWLLLTLVAIIHMRRWLAHVVMPSNLPCLMFIAWIVFTATVSPHPAYSAVAALSIFAYVIFSAFLFSSFGRVEIFLVTVMAITVFCIVSIAVYFAVPELGRFVFWLNDQRHVSSRMAGIAGSANNMGRLAAFGLVLIILYASEFRRVHPLLVPACTAVLSVSLVMTNSRSAMAMVLALGAAALLLRWRRLHLLVLVVSAGLLAAALVLPLEDGVLRLISRSGDIDEITSMTGRSSIWSAVPRLIEGREWTGFGYASSVFVLPQHEREVGFLTSHAHNIVLQLLLTTGWIGVALFCLSIVSVGVRAAYLADRTVLILLSFVLLNGITESSAFGTVANVCSLAFAFAVTLPPEWKNDEDDCSY
jgi:O-antigen ligase